MSFLTLNHVMFSRSFSFSHCGCCFLFVLFGHRCLKHTIVGTYPAWHFKPSSRARKIFVSSYESSYEFYEKFTKLIFTHKTNVQKQVFSIQKLSQESFFFTKLTHSFPMHPSSTPWKHQKTLRFSNVFRWPDIFWG